MNARPATAFPAVAALALLLAACAQAPRMDPPPPVAYVSPQYLIGADDVLAISVWQYPEMTTSAPVRSDGMITVALIGDVQAGGRTPMAVAAQIRADLAAFVRDAQVTVQVSELRSHEYLARVRVTGAVRQPVSLVYRQGMTVLDAVLEAGGPTDFAASNRTALHRREGQGSRSYSVALGSILDNGELSSNFPVQPGDVISVPQRSF